MTPRARSPWSRSTDASDWSMTTLSVISSSRQAGSRPAWSRIAATFEISADSANWRADRLTLMARSGRGREPPLPVPQLVARGLEDPPPDRQDEPGLLGQRDERERRHEAARRVLPAQQRLHAQHGARVEVDQRLVVEPQLGALDRPPQVVLERRPVDASGRASRGRTGSSLRTGSAFARWSAISACLSRSNGCGSAARPDRDAHARADGDLGAVEVERRPRWQPRSATRRARPRARCGPAPAGSRTRPSRAARRCPWSGPPSTQALAHLRQQLVAGRVAEALVDDLEAVEVEEDQRDPGPGRASPAAPRARRPPPAPRAGSGASSGWAGRSAGRGGRRGHGAGPRSGRARTGGRCRGRSTPAARTARAPRPRAPRRVAWRRRTRGRSGPGPRRPR